MARASFTEVALVSFTTSIICWAAASASAAAVRGLSVGALTVRTLEFEPVLATFTE